TASFATGGAGAGKAVFSLLLVGCHLPSCLSTLFGDVASGRHLKSVELVGAESIKDQSVKLYDVKLSDVLVSSFENDPGSNGVERSEERSVGKVTGTRKPTPTEDVLSTQQK